MPEKQNPHQHFKMTDTNVSHFFCSPKKMAILIAVAMIVCICALVIFFNDKKTPQQSLVVPEEKSFNENQDNANLNEKYQIEAKKIVSEYLEQRKNFNNENDNTCQNVIKKTAEKVMQLVVPAEFKKFHLELVVALDKENEYCLIKNGFKEPVTNSLWDELKLKNDWLN